MDKKRLRTSIGSAILLGLRKGKLPHPPTAIYLMVGERCLNNCAFCTQARDSDSGPDMLSRVSWPEFSEDDVLSALINAKDLGSRRICLQCLNDPDHLSTITELIRNIRGMTDLPISLSIGPVSSERAGELRSAGVERIGIALDGASDEVFDRIKGKQAGNSLTFDDTWKALGTSLDVFGRGMVSTHIIVGMGETDRDVFNTMSRANSMGVLVSLFSFTPMKGISFEGTQPSLGRYRSLQVLRHLIFVIGQDVSPLFQSSGKMRQLDISGLEIEDLKEAFMTRGCPDCNRPYYNERPGGDIFNYPYVPDDDQTERELKVMLQYLGPDNI